MPVTELNHHLLRANDLERTREFYVNAPGFSRDASRSRKTRAARQ
jgi:hypothetical protein